MKLAWDRATRTTSSGLDEPTWNRRMLRLQVVRDLRIPDTNGCYRLVDWRRIQNHTSHRSATVEPTPADSSTETAADEYHLATWMRVYLHGVLAFVVL